MTDNRPIGIFDSGLGGLALAKSIRSKLPHESYIYIADTKNAPYGPQSKSKIIKYSETITEFLMDLDVKAILIACNTATVSAIDHLRIKYPYQTFIGVEPALKPAANQTKTGIVGVMATQNTLNSARYQALKHTFDHQITFVSNPCLGLVKLIEKGDFNSNLIYQKLQAIIQPMLNKKIDQLVLGCTHYPLIISQISSLLPTHVNIIDPISAVIKQLSITLIKNNLKTSIPPKTHYYTTNNLNQFSKFASQVLNQNIKASTLTFS